MKNRRRHSRKLNSNKRRSSRRHRRSSLALRMNGLKRNLRRNPVVAGLKSLVKPVGIGAGGFVAARLIGYGAAKVSGITSMLDKADPVTAPNTKIVANLVGIVGTLVLAPKIPYLKDNKEAFVIGMGLALMDRLIAKLAWAPALGETYYAAAGFGEYVNSPMGEYVNSPMGSFGEYVNSPMGDTYYAAAGVGEYDEGIDPSDQGQIDGVMDVMEAAAGVGGEITPEMAQIGKAFGIKQFVNTNNPTDIAQGVTAQLPNQLPVTAGPVSQEDLPRSTPGGRGYAGGVFSANLFSGMAGY